MLDRSVLMHAIAESGKGEFDPSHCLQPTTQPIPNTYISDSGSEKCYSNVSKSKTSALSKVETTRQCPFSGQEFKQREAASMKKLVFGVGPRTCSGQNLAVTEIAVLLVVLCHEVKGIKMAEEEQERPMAPIFPHPTGLLDLVART